MGAEVGRKRELLIDLHRALRVVMPSWGASAWAAWGRGEGRAGMRGLLPTQPVLEIAGWLARWGNRGTEKLHAPVPVGGAVPAGGRGAAG